MNFLCCRVVLVEDMVMCRFVYISMSQYYGSGLQCKQCKLVLDDVVHIVSLKVLLDNLHVLIVYTISNIPKIESAHIRRCARQGLGGRTGCLKNLGGVGQYRPIIIVI